MVGKKVVHKREKKGEGYEPLMLSKADKGETKWLEYLHRKGGVQLPSVRS